MQGSDLNPFNVANRDWPSRDLEIPIRRQNEKHSPIRRPSVEAIVYRSARPTSQATRQFTEGTPICVALCHWPKAPAAPTVSSAQLVLSQIRVVQNQRT